MNKKVTKVVAATVGTAMFAGMLVSGVGASAKQVEAKENNNIIAGTASSWSNFMNTVWDNGTSVQVFRTKYGYGAWAADSNGNIIGNEPIARTAYYLPIAELNAGCETAYGDFVAAYEVTVNDAPYFAGNTIQTYYDVADFAYNVPDHYDHFGYGSDVLPVFQNDYTSSATLDPKGNALTSYVFGFDFGDYNEHYVEFVGTTWSLTNKNVVDNTQIGVYTATKYPEFNAAMDIPVYNEAGTKVVDYVPEVYANPVFEDAWSLAYNWASPMDSAEDVLLNTGVDVFGDPFIEAGQMIPQDEFGTLPWYGDYWWEFDAE
jgi:hypothetical protein